MAHLLIVDLPGGNDYDILDAAIRGGHEFSFISSDLAHYEKQPDVMARLRQASVCMEIPGFDYEQAERLVMARHAIHAFDAVLCLVDIRLIEAARLARAVGVRFLSPDVAELLRDKSAVRARLAARGLRQPEFRIAENTQELVMAVDDIGLPALIKPVDGYGSQNIVVLLERSDLDPWISPLEHLLPAQMDYGFGVRGRDKLLVERYMAGTLLGCDTMTVGGRHQLIGVHRKTMFPPPSFAIRGGTFTTREDAHLDLEAYLHEVLDAVGFDDGAAHVEVIITEEGPALVEINGRLVGAKIPRLVNCALDESIHAALIRLHLGDLDPATLVPATSRVAVSRWIVAEGAGRLEKIAIPDERPAGIRQVDLLARPGERVSPPFENADRLGFVMSTALSASDAERLADDFVNSVSVVVTADR